MLGPSHMLFAANAWAVYAVWTGESMTQLGDDKKSAAGIARKRREGAEDDP